MATNIPAVATTLQRRSVGFIVRHGSAVGAKQIEKPSDVARYIGKVAKELGADERKKHVPQCAQLVDSMCRNITQYTAMEVRAVAHGMPIIFGADISSAWLQAIATFALKRAHMMPVYLLYPIVNSLCRMAKHERDVPVDQMLAVCRERVAEANSIDLATIAQTATLLKRSREILELMNAVADAATSETILEGISTTNAVLILYSFGQMGIRHKKLYQSMTQIITKMEHDDFQSHLIPIALHALAKFGNCDRNVLETIANHAIKVANNMQPENVSGTVCALAKLKFRHSLLLREMAKRTRELMSDMNLREMLCNRTGNILWGFAKLRHSDEDLIDEMIGGDRCAQYPRIDNMSFAQIFEALRCYHAVHKAYSNAAVVKALLPRYIEVMPQCSTQIVTQVAWCCCSLGCNDCGIIVQSLDVLKSRKRTKVEQKYVNMLLDALKHAPMEPEEILTHYEKELRTSGTDGE
ncbi:hypothetical protein, conserved [Babesia bigemina]|uniref:RNA-editing substrate-binding complex 6 protein domain-containing protein n=1 Tax=Babesia bigemina TaxID=5866 RepID=A0A061D3D9_BABBI|nr:hypothetical protein, conserved [Babesia bigemina]CDR95246.1 hypothetical protein, conserved [Babesia bigemina]|eukprot:XP_012767432.1 hypothetical protein, conserved [Babesia bigemina]